ncbi:MAG: hypothetical protein PUC65_15260, partial [Clostridiales bacterium]|nr:hypothetical protein [Clostridiales bacterium]
MNYKILNQYNEDVNHLVAKVMRYVAVLIMCVGLATLLHIFIIDGVIMMYIIMCSLVCLFIPTILFDVLKINKAWAEYFVLGLVVLYIGLLYSMLSYHVVIMFLFPFILASLYNKRKYIIYVSAL